MKSINETIDGSIKDIIQLKTVNNSLEYAQMFDALTDTPQGFQNKLVATLNSLGQTLGIPPTDAFNKVMCAGADDDVRKKLYNWWRGVFEVMSSCEVPKDKEDEFEGKVDDLMAEICKAGDKASDDNEVVLEDDTKPVNEMWDSLKYGSRQLTPKEKTKPKYKKGDILYSTYGDRCRVVGSPKWDKFHGWEYEVWVMDGGTTIAYYDEDKLSPKKPAYESYEHAAKKDENKMMADMKFAIQHLGEIANKVQSLINFINPYCESKEVIMKKEQNQKMVESAIAHGMNVLRKELQGIRTKKGIVSESCEGENPGEEFGEDWKCLDCGHYIFGVVDEIANDCQAEPDQSHRPDSLHVAGIWEVGSFGAPGECNYDDGSECVPHFIVKLYGGCNGNPDPRTVLTYLAVVRKFAKIMLERIARDIWLVDWKNDCSDDVWEVRFGFYLAKDQEEVLREKEAAIAAQNVQTTNAPELPAAEAPVEQPQPPTDETPVAPVAAIKLNESKDATEWVSMDNLIGETDDAESFWSAIDMVDKLEKKGYWSGKFKVGDEVCWVDPETGRVTCGWKVVDAPEPDDDGEIPEDGIYVIAKDDGSEAEVYGKELRPKTVKETAGEPLDEYEFIDLMKDDDTGDVFEVYDGTLMEDGSVCLNVIVNKDDTDNEEVKAEFGDFAEQYGWKYESFSFSSDLVGDEGTETINVYFRPIGKNVDESDLENELNVGDDGWKVIGQPVGEATVVVDANDVWDVLDLLDDETANKNLTDLINSHVRTEEEIMDAIENILAQYGYSDGVPRDALNGIFSADNIADVIEELGLDVEAFMTKREFVDPQKPVTLESDWDEKPAEREEAHDKPERGTKAIVNGQKVDADSGYAEFMRIANMEPRRRHWEENKEGDKPDEVKDGDKKYKQDGETKTLVTGEREMSDKDAATIMGGASATDMDAADIGVSSHEVADPYKKPICEMTIEQDVTDPWKLLNLLWGQGKERLKELLDSNLFSDDRIMDTIEQFEIVKLSTLNDFLAFEFESLLEALGCDVDAWNERGEISRGGSEEVDEAARKAKEPVDPVAKKLEDLIPVDDKDGFMYVRMDNRYGTGSYVAYYAPGSEPEIKHAAVELAKALPEYTIGMLEYGILFMPKKRA